MRENDIIYGKNPVTELLKKGDGVDTVYISENLAPNLQSYYTALAKSRGRAVKRVNPAKLKSLRGTDNHQGVAAFASSVEYVSLEQVLSDARNKGEDPFIILRDGIEDPHNLGAIIRSAYLLGAHGIIIPKRGGAQITGTVHKSSSGAALQLPIVRVANIGQAVRDLKKANVFVYCLDMSPYPLYKQDLTGPIRLVVGSEGSGVQPLVKKLCDGTVSVPMRANGASIDSFNASVAAGIAMYEVYKQRES